MDICGFFIASSGLLAVKVKAIFLQAVLKTAVVLFFAKLRERSEDWSKYSADRLQKAWDKVGRKVTVRFVHLARSSR
jgi:hypothetical protein